MRLGSRQRLPPDPGYGWFELMRAYRADPLRVLSETARRCGDLATFRLGPYRIYTINHPDLIGDVLVTNARKFHKGRIVQGSKALLGEGLLTSEDDLHLRQRRLVQPAFQPHRLDVYAGVFAALAERCAAQWEVGQTLDMTEAMQRLTLDAATRTLLGADLADPDAATVLEALTDGIAVFDLIATPLGRLALWSPLPAAARFRRARRRLDAVVYRLIENRRAAASARDDLLSLLVATGGMSDRQLRDETVTMLVGGHETAAHALAWTWLLLSQNPDAERRLHAELAAVLAGRAPLPSDLGRLEYCERVLLESLRLYPPGWALPRLAVEDHELAGYPIRAGSIVVVCLPLVHRDPRWWEAPDRFDPDRWAPEVRTARPRHAYLPFSAGPRMCIGRQFAFTESMIILATLAQQWRARLVPGHPVEVSQRFTLRPKYGLPMTLERR